MATLHEAFVDPYLRVHIVPLDYYHVNPELGSVINGGVKFRLYDSKVSQSKIFDSVADIYNQKGEPDAKIITQDRISLDGVSLADPNVDPTAIFKSIQNSRVKTTADFRNPNAWTLAVSFL